MRPIASDLLGAGLLAVILVALVVVFVVAALPAHA